MMWTVVIQGDVTRVRVYSWEGEGRNENMELDMKPSSTCEHQFLFSAPYNPYLDVVGTSPNCRLMLSLIGCQ